MATQVIQLLLIGVLAGVCIGLLLGVWIGSVLARENYEHHLKLQYKHTTSLKDERSTLRRPRRVYDYDDRR